MDIPPTESTGTPPAESSPPTGPPYGAIVAILIAAAAGPFVWYGCYAWFEFSFVAALLIGIGMGLGVRATQGAKLPGDGIAAAVAVVLSAAVGHIYLDQFVYLWSTPRTLGDSFEWMVRDIRWVLFTGFSAYLAYAISRSGK